ncbi:hypothetical protein P154DRAFT_596872 [Amniculicola lignicola CBS 123094]|uniref:F-box domain-containing protein n=1 Tax=Amniculicola lignicola CBS 123094 TaxID=1392246 RepID=A0A6A5WQ75_9PLEO|nr:hypothetical protein P154DRAFT_596872 [Amniculicola lignicola CBS 123094]
MSLSHLTPSIENYRKRYLNGPPISPSSPSHLKSLTTTNAQTSPFLLLPPELRNEIYLYVLTGKHIAIRSFGSRKRPRCLATTSEPEIRNLPRVCRQIYIECGTLIYSHNTIDLGGLPYISKWLRQRLDVQLGAISSVGLKLEDVGMLTRGMRRLKDTFPNLGDVVLWREPADRRGFERAGEMGEEQGVRVWVRREGLRRLRRGHRGWRWRGAVGEGRLLLVRRGEGEGEEEEGG